MDKQLNMKIPNIFTEITQNTHTLIAGSTGSGKSVLINGLIYSLLSTPPNESKFILIDPKRVELIDYKHLPHTITYANTIKESLSAFNYALRLMEHRYKKMQKQRLKQSNNSIVYIIIDEYADLIAQDKKAIEYYIIRLSQLGRAANIKLILATQRSTRDIITGTIKINIDNRVALRVPSAQDSRNIIEAKGAELLPVYGQGLYRTPLGLMLVNLPIIPEDKIQEAICHWTRKV